MATKEPKNCQKRAELYRILVIVSFKNQTVPIHFDKTIKSCSWLSYVLSYWLINQCKYFGCLCCLNLQFLAGIRAISSSVLFVQFVVGFVSKSFFLGLFLPWTITFQTRSKICINWNINNLLCCIRFFQQVVQKLLSGKQKGPTIKFK